MLKTWAQDRHQDESLDDLWRKMEGVWRIEQI
ncbi:predicted protein [Sclerotinia sclerotiorum 1980 UF-70]|uniref:Uncharacterized protein n=1 Tax=Sclerotinia sclerotiorum (strain ATCC 18683 / 1980 / Ss-1) TaxID=665079 RepID=A7EED1_SCLS1|nr:predicted protein [Sclerotinia sclerotiorum 1980 UF-70]EDO01197.1 predicted protein [Sclerotinia sclerotiorum 1980 UF-70]